MNLRQNMRSTGRIYLPKYLFLFSLVLFQTVMLLAAPSNLDLRFGSNGIVLTDFGNNVNNARDEAGVILLQADGKIVVAGGVRNTSTDFGVVRYNNDGSIDLSFGNNGKTVSDFGFNDRVLAGVIQSDGKIVVGGYAGANFALARYNVDGSPDSNFGDNGKVITNINSPFPVVQGIETILVQPDGKIIAIGNINDFDFCLARYNPNGTPDTSFGNGGKVIIRYAVEGNEAESAILLADGKILVGGYIGTPTSSSNFALFRFNPNGTLDNTFDGDGVVSTEVGSSFDRIGGIILRPDNKILAIGTSGNGALNINQFALALYNQDGTLDLSFGQNGISILPAPLMSSVKDVVLQPDGKIFVTAEKTLIDGNWSVFHVARFNPDGTYDTHFGNMGRASLLIGSYSNASCVAIQPDGKLLVAGTGKRNFRNPDSDFALIRYMGGASSLPNNAGISGQVLFSPGRSPKVPVRLKLTGGSLTSPLYAQANVFGYFRFHNVPTGSAYQVTIESKVGYFDFRSLQVLLNDNVNDVYFIAR